MIVPVTTRDLEKTGTIVEGLSAESYKYYIPAYYEVLMGAKLTQDQDSVEMLDLIYETCVFDIGRNYLDNDPMQSGFTSLLQSKSTDFVSYYEKHAAATQKRLDKLYESVIDN